jgi:aspartate carbamoyltransferase regulatory subunit
VSRPKDFRLTDGTVIDHLPVGCAARAVEMLGLPREGAVTIGLGVPSRRYGRKDIVRVEGLALSKAELDRLALLGRRLTVSIVKDGEVKKKVILEVPARVEGLLACPNPTCVTNHERIPTAFHRLGSYPYRFRCHFCERVIEAAEAAIGAGYGA